MDINTVIQSYGAVQTSNATSYSAASTKETDTAGNNATSETVQLSAQGKALSELPPIILPTRENVQKLSSALANDLQSLFSKAGIKPEPAVEFNVDSYTGAVSVKGNRPDSRKIAELIKDNPEIEMQIHNVAAISSHVVAMGKAMEADTAYRNAKTPEEIKNVIAQYSSVYSGHLKVTDFSLIFNGSNIQVNANGETWLTSQA
jgi:hypothetical protein